jgi:hypothetical protein
MIRTLHPRLIAPAALGLVAAALVCLVAPIAAAGTAPTDPVSLPAWMTRIQYPGTSSEPIVSVSGRVTIPAWLARIQGAGAVLALRRRQTPAQV